MLRHLVLLLSLVFAAPYAFSATVTKVKDDKIVMTMASKDRFQVGQKIKVLNKENKTVAIALITLVKDNKAVAKIQKGKAREGLKAELTKASLEAAGGSRGDEDNSRAAKSMKTMRPGKAVVGGIAGLIMDSADVTFTPTGGTKQTVALSGMGFSGKALYDMPLSSFYGVRILTGLEQFVATGPSKASCGGACEIKINYLTFDGWGRYFFSNSNYKPWAGVGLSLMYPMTKSSSTLDEDSIKMTSFLNFGGGIDYRLSATSQIPIQVEYGFAPSSADVKASALAVRVGYSFDY